MVAHNSIHVKNSHKLDIGCGGRKYFFNPRVQGEDVVYADIEAPTRRIHNFVRCDAHYLPFRENVFSEIYASHIIEHLNNPAKFLMRCKEVLSRTGRIHILTPNWISRAAWADQSHKWVFNVVTLALLLIRTGYLLFPTRYILLRRLYVIGVLRK